MAFLLSSSMPISSIASYSDASVREAPFPAMRMIRPVAYTYSNSMSSVWEMAIRKRSLLMRSFNSASLASVMSVMLQ